MVARVSGGGTLRACARNTQPQVLREPALRAAYDHQLSQAELRATVVLQDEIELHDMQHVAGSGSSEHAHTHQHSPKGATQQAAGCSSGSSSSSEQGSQGQQQRHDAAAACAVRYTFPCRCGDCYALTPADVQLAASSHQIICPCRCVQLWHVHVHVQLLLLLLAALLLRVLQAKRARAPELGGTITDQATLC